MLAITKKLALSATERGFQIEDCVDVALAQKKKRLPENATNGITGERYNIITKGDLENVHNEIQTYARLAPVSRRTARVVMLTHQEISYPSRLLPVAEASISNRKALCDHVVIRGERRLRKPPDGSRSCLCPSR
jgi:hypothetical protein